MRSKRKIAAAVAAVLVLMFSLASGAVGVTTSPRQAAQVACSPAPAIKKIAIMGDSLTTSQGASAADKSWPVMLQEYGAARGWVVGSYGIGATLADEYEQGRNLFFVTQTVRDWKPDLVLMDWRTNDQIHGRTPGQLKASLLAIADQIRVMSPSTRFMIVNPPLMWYHDLVSPEAQRTYAAKMREAADELDGFYVDLEPFFPQAGPSWASRATLPDDIHPNDAGHLRYLTVISLALRQATF